MARATLWENFVPSLKVRCVAAYCLQQSLFDFLPLIVPLAGQDVVASLLDSLNESRILSCEASLDEDLALAFQEAMFSEWGDGVEEVEEALSAGRLSSRSGSAMFFLTQESSATNSIMHMLSILYQSKGESDGFCDWDREKFAEPFLLERMMDVLWKFLQSERRDGHLIDPNIWRISSESGGKLAIYCTSFAVVVVSILNTMLSISREQFARHKQQFFPVLCSLVRVQSDEIRNLVGRVLAEQIAPLLDVTMTP